MSKLFFDVVLPDAHHPGYRILRMPDFSLSSAQFSKREDAEKYCTRLNEIEAEKEQERVRRVNAKTILG